MNSFPPSEWDTRLDDDVRRLVRRLASAAARVRQGADDQAVHDLRVAARRLDAALDLWRPLLRGRARRRARRGLNGLRRRLGPLREAEVDAATLRERLDGLSPETRIAASLLLARLARRVERGRLRAAAACAEDRIAPIRGQIARAFARRQSAAAAGSPPEVRARLERLERRERERAHAASDPRDETLHRARVATKRLRYALERGAAVGPPFDATGEPARIGRLAAVQEALGHICDLMALRDRVVRFSRRLAVVDPAAAAALEPLLGLIASQRDDAAGSIRTGVAAIDAVPPQPARLGLAGGGPGPRPDHR